jgi:hypothetical protein
VDTILLRQIGTEYCTFTVGKKESVYGDVIFNQETINQGRGEDTMRGGGKGRVSLTKKP